MKQLIKDLLNKCNAICFDFDSTIINYEGIDKLAKQKNCYDVVSRITKEAMESPISLSESLEKRLNIIKPSNMDIIKYRNNISFDNISSGLIDILNFLRNNNKNIFIISGGFEQLIFPYTKFLKIPNENVYCNSLIFDDDGNYLNFDRERLTCKSKGKNKVINNIIQNKIKDLKNLLFKSFSFFLENNSYKKITSNKIIKKFNNPVPKINIIGSKDITETANKLGISNFFS